MTNIKKTAARVGLRAGLATAGGLTPLGPMGAQLGYQAGSALSNLLIHDDIVKRQKMNVARPTNFGYSENPGKVNTSVVPYETEENTDAWLGMVDQIAPKLLGMANFTGGGQPPVPSFAGSKDFANVDKGLGKKPTTGIGMSAQTSVFDDSTPSTLPMDLPSLRSQQMPVDAIIPNIGMDEPRLPNMSGETEDIFGNDRLDSDIINDAKDKMFKRKKRFDKFGNPILTDQAITPEVSNYRGRAKF